MLQTVTRVLALAWLAAAPTMVAIGKEATPAPVKIGDRVRDVRFKDIRFVIRSLRDFGDAKVIVVVFTDTRCPVAAKYMPRLNELTTKYAEHGVQFLGVNSSPGDGMVEVAADALEKKIAFPVHKDFDQSALKALGASRTPEVVVLDEDRVIRYRGRVDDQFRVAGAQPGIGRRHLEEALEAVLGGKAVAVAETPVEGCLISPRPAPSKSDVTYSEHVAPIIQKRCQTCHRPNHQAPFSLLTYDDAATHADMIREVVEERRMPPFFRDRRYGKFINHPPLSPEEIDTIAAWVARGGPRGDPRKLPPPIEWPKDVWQIGQPDRVVPMTEEFEVPATGYVDYHYATLDHEFPHDTWVQAIQILPGNRRVVHHANLYAREPKKGGGRRNVFITGYVPGGDVTRYGKNSGILIKKGSKLRLQIHYTTTGKKETDRTSVGLVWAKETIRKRTKILFVVNPFFAIPPRDSAAEVRMRLAFDEAAIGVGLFIHMHLRGKDMTFIAHYPDGTKETLLSVPNYSFDWQMSYRWPQGARRFPKGTIIETISHYDNSRFNPFNPDPSKTVRHGQQTYHEMNYGFVFYTSENEGLSIEVDPATGREMGGREF